MAQKKTMMRPRSWASIKRARAGSEERRVKEIFELGQQVRLARGQLDITQAEWRSEWEAHSPRSRVLKPVQAFEEQS